MAYVQAVTQESFGNWPGLGAVRSAKQRRRGARRRRKRARKLSRTAVGRAALAQAAARVAAGTATGRQRRLVSSAGVVAKRARKPGITRRMRMVRELAATAAQRRAAAEAPRTVPTGPVLVTDERGIVPPPPRYIPRRPQVIAEGPRPRRLDFVRRLAEDRARREAESGTPRAALVPRYFDEPPVDFGPSRPPFDFPSTRGEVAPVVVAAPPESGAMPGWLIPAAAAAAAAFLL